MSDIKTAWTPATKCPPLDLIGKPLVVLLKIDRGQQLPWIGVYTSLGWLVNGMGFVEVTDWCDCIPSKEKT